MISLKEENACREASKKRKDRALKPCIEVSNRRKKERARDIKNFVVKCANATSPAGSSEHRSQCEHALEDIMQALRHSNTTYDNVKIDNNTTDHSVIQSNNTFEETNDESSRYFDLELSNKKYKKAKKLLLEHSGVKLLPRSQLENSTKSSSFIGFKVKWMQKKTNVDDSTYEEEEENFGDRMDFVDSMK